MAGQDIAGLPQPDGPSPADTALKITSGRLRLLGALAILTSTLICYWPAVRGDFVWDDDRHVSENRNLRDLPGLERIWFRVGATPQYYPMTHTSFWIENHLWGLRPTGYHLTNILLHAVNAVLLWKLLEMLEVPGAFLAAAVFALHPVNVESVAWISERKNVLAMGFALASMIVFLQGTTTRSYVASLVLFVCALLSKTVVATAPAVLLVILWWKQDGPHPNPPPEYQGRGQKALPLLIPFFVLGIAAGVVTAVMEHSYVGARGPDWQFSFIDRGLIAGRAVCFYVGKVLLPMKLTFSYARWEIDPRVWWQWIFPFAVVVVLIAAWLSRERLGRGVIAALLIFVGTLFPALGFINTYPMRYSFVADHFVYESAPALIALVVAGLVMLLGRAAVPVAVLLVAVLGALTWNQAHIFAGPESLWRDTIAKNPTSWMARHNLAVCLSAWSDRDRDAGDIAEARQKLQESLELFDQVHALRPQHEKLPINRAIAERKLKLLDEPDDTGTLLDVGLLLARSARTAEAVQPLERYVTLKPDDAEAHVSLGFVYGELGRYEPAREQFQRALQLDPQSAGARQGLELVRRATNITELPRTGQ